MVVMNRQQDGRMYGRTDDLTQENELARVANKARMLHYI